MPDKKIEALWSSYRAILPKDAGTTQIIETRRAFYAGAQGLFHAILNSLEPGQDATDGDLKYMDDIQRELSDFAMLIKDGVA